jgi:4'-phosphopantetheinyl transferase
MTCADFVAGLSGAAPSAEIDVWRADLSREAAVSRVVRVLSQGERARAGRLRPADRRRYILAHGALRAILGSYTDQDPAELVFQSGPGGKPALSGGNLRFNLSHSGDVAVCGVSRTVAIGVDVEHVLPEVAREVARHLPLRARRRLQALSEVARSRAFFLAWTRMESCAKAGGDGLGQGADLADLDAFLEPSTPAERQSGWWLHDFTPRSDFVGTVAAAHGGCRLTFWQLDANLNPKRGRE